MTGPGSPSDSKLSFSSQKSTAVWTEPMGPVDLVVNLGSRWAWWSLLASLGTVQDSDKLRVVSHQNCLPAGDCSVPGTYPTQDEPTTTYKLCEAWGAHFGDGKTEAQNDFQGHAERELVTPRGQESGSFPPSIAYSSSNSFFAQPQFLTSQDLSCKKTQHALLTPSSSHRHPIPLFGPHIKLLVSTVHPP